MATTERGSHDDNHPAKLAPTADQRRVTPYTGTKYQKSVWVPHVYETELAIYETILASNRTLTNEQVGQALVRLVQKLRNGESGALPDGSTKLDFAAGQE